MATRGSGPQWKDSFTQTVTGSSQKVADLVARRQYRLTSTVDAWFKVVAAGNDAEVRTDNSHLIVAGQEVLVYTSDADQDLAIIKDTGAADGACCLSEVIGNP